MLFNAFIKISGLLFVRTMTEINGSWFIYHFVEKMASTSLSLKLLSLSKPFMQFSHTILQSSNICCGSSIPPHQKIHHSCPPCSDQISPPLYCPKQKARRPVDQEIYKKQRKSPFLHPFPHTHRPVTADIIGTCRAWTAPSGCAYFMIHFRSRAV